MIKKEVLAQLTSVGRALAESLRKKKSVDRSIVRKVGVAENIVFVQYEPGNDRCYEVLLTRLDSGVREIGIEQFAWLVTHLNGSPIRSMVVQPPAGAFAQTAKSDILAPRYVSEKLGVSEADGVVLAELMGAFTGRPTVKPDEYLLRLYHQDEVGGATSARP